MLLHVLSAVGVSSAAVLTYALLLVVHPTHFLQAQYAIPVLVNVAFSARFCLLSYRHNMPACWILGPHCAARDASPLPVAGLGVLFCLAVHSQLKSCSSLSVLQSCSCCQVACSEPTQVAQPKTWTTAICLPPIAQQ